jgi:hypothetical protein
VPPDQPAYLEVDPNQNWGLAYPGYQMSRYVELVPRPPRPGTVLLAIYLTYVGVVVSGMQVLLNALYTWSRRDEILASATRDAPPGADMSGFFDTTLTIGLIIGLLFWLLPAAGTVVCVELARRGRNAPRIVLACLAGVFALYNLCSSGFAVIAGLAGPVETESGSVSFTTGITWWGTLIQMLLGAAAVAILVLLLVRPSHRYFSPGPGRRFAPSP